MNKNKILYLTLSQFDEYELQGLYMSIAKENSLYINDAIELRRAILQHCSSNSELEELFIKNGEKMVSLYEEYQENKGKVLDELQDSIKKYF